MEVILCEPGGNHESSNQTLRAVEESSSYVLDEASRESNENEGPDSDAFYDSPCLMFTKTTSDASGQSSEGFDGSRLLEDEAVHTIASSMKWSSSDSDTSNETSQESNESYEPDYEAFRDFFRLIDDGGNDTSGETSESDEAGDEIFEDTTDDGSYIETDGDDNRSSDGCYPIEDNPSPNSHQDRHSEESDEDDYTFQGTYPCYPLSALGKLHLENGNQIVMPSSALERLLDIEVEFPMLFEIRNNQPDGRLSHCDVSEFTAEEGLVYLPKWMMQNLELNEGDFVNIKSVELENGTFMKLQPHSVDFSSISNPKAALEEGLTNNFFCLTTGDTITIPYGGKSFYINIVETKPTSSISIINTDCEVDFDLPLDYKKPERPARPVKEQKAVEEKPRFVPFSGLARRLNETHSIEPDSSTAQKENPRTDADDASADMKHEVVYAPFLDYQEPERPTEPVKEKIAADQVKFEFKGVARQSATKSVYRGITEERVETKTSKRELFQPFSGRKYSLMG